MLDNLLGGILGGGTKPGEEKKEGGLSGIMPILIIIGIIYIGMKILAPKEEKPPLPEAPPANPLGPDCFL